MENLLILVINPRAIYTRVAVYQGHSILFLKDIQHPDQDLGRFSHYLEQVEYRTSKIFQELKDNGVCLDCIRAVVGRGGLLKPIESGIYRVNEAMLRDLESEEYGEDPVNLGGLVAWKLSQHWDNCLPLIVDPVVVDEFCELARLTGHKLFQKKSVFHALNQKAMARKHAKAHMKNYEDLKLIVAHLGSGISVGAHKYGKVIDSNQVLDGDGPFSPERTGSLPLGDVVRYCFRSGKSEDEILNMIMHEGGLYSYLGTYSAYEVDKRVQSGDEEAAKVFEAMAYQVSKEIGAMYAALESEVDAIIITGGIANSTWFVSKIIQRVKNMAPVHIYPGMREIESMAHRTLGALNGEIELKEYN
ncbi:MAG: butyrate kinase [Bacteroidales bacterium]|nr:butyrate kinase [Bacteroidales bacterium]